MIPQLIRRTEGREFVVDSSVTIEELYDGKDFKFDVAIGRIAGHHPRLINEVSDRAYFVISGSLVIHAGDASFDVSQHDLVVIPAGTPHGVDGEGEYVVVTAPPFAEENERVVE